MSYFRTCHVTCECGRTLDITIEAVAPFDELADAALDVELRQLGWTPNGPTDDVCPVCNAAEAGA